MRELNYFSQLGFKIKGLLRANDTLQKNGFFNA